MVKSPKRILLETKAIKDEIRILRFPTKEVRKYHFSDDFGSHTNKKLDMAHHCLRSDFSRLPFQRLVQH